MKIVPLTRKVRDLTRGRDVRAQQGKDPLRWVLLAVVFVLTVLLTSPSVWLQPLPTEADSTITSPIVSQVRFEFQPEDATERWERRRDEEHTRVFEYVSNVRSRAVDRVMRILEVANAIEINESLNMEDVKAQLVSRDPQIANWSEPEIRALLSLAADERFREAARMILEDIYSGSFVVTGADWIKYEAARQYARVDSPGLPPPSAAEASPRRYPQETTLDLRNALNLRAEEPIRRAGGNVAEDTALLETMAGETALRLLKLGVQPNFIYDEEETRLAFERFPRELPQVIPKGAVLSPWMKGATEQAVALESWRFPHRVTVTEAEILQSYASKLSRVRLLKFVAQVLFVLITFLIISFFVIKFSRELAFNTQTVLLLSLPVLLALGLGRVFLLIAGDANSYAGYAFPAGVIGILGVLLLDVRLAILLVTWGCVLFGLEANLRYEFVIVGLLGGYTGVAALYTFRERREVLYAGLLIGIVNASTILILDYIGDQTQQAWTAAAIGAMAGIFCSLISFAVLPVFEVAFHITTDMRLLELSGLQHPVLREMEDKAPGTLQHTMNVAKLAESAATAIGVNYLLVRAGVYFHDIGKISKPEYFTENQLTPEDKRRHESLTPNMSTLIIRNHVKEGVELARKYKLPRIVADFIPEHHGTSLIQYFYLKALKAYEKGEIREPVREEDFRYPGPKPQTIESAIVMLADTVEATSTAKLSGKAVREDDIQMLVRNAISEKFNDGQFDDCNLTLRDLNTIRESFVKTLRSRFHARIDYPAMRKQTDSSKRGGGDDRSSTETGFTTSPDFRDTRVSREIATGAGKGKG